MATHSRILACKILWTEEEDHGYGPWGCKESDKTEHSTQIAMDLEIAMLNEVNQTKTHTI